MHDLKYFDCLTADLQFLQEIFYFFSSWLYHVYNVNICSFFLYVCEKKGLPGVLSFRFSFVLREV